MLSIKKETLTGSAKDKIKFIKIRKLTPMSALSICSVSPISSPNAPTSKKRINLESFCEYSCNNIPAYIIRKSQLIGVTFMILLKTLNKF